MSENGLQKSMEEQLEQLKLEQEQAEQIYKRRMEMGALTYDPASVQILAQTILDRKLKIEELESQIAPKEGSVQNDNRNDTIQEYQETSLVQYHRNPIINFLQKIMIKMEEISEKMEQKRLMRENRMPIEPKIAETKWDEYQHVANNDYAQTKQGTQEKTAHQLFVEKISGNGAYHTFGKNAQNVQQTKINEEIQTVANQVKKEENSR